MKWLHERRVSARALIITNDQILIMHRKRYSMVSGEWIEYYSIPGGGLEKDELPEIAVARELKEEMGLQIKNIKPVAHCLSKNFEHYVYTADVKPGSIPVLQADSEEAMYHHTVKNQFIPAWINIKDLTSENLRYYASYLPLIDRLNSGDVVEEVVEIAS